MKIVRALRISKKIKIFIDGSKIKPTGIDPEIKMCSLAELMIADNIANEYNIGNKCKRYLIVGDVFLSALYLCLHGIPQKYGVLDPVITIKNKTVLLHSLPGEVKEIVN